MNPIAASAVSTAKHQDYQREANAYAAGKRAERKPDQVPRRFSILSILAGVVTRG